MKRAARLAALPLAIDPSARVPMWAQLAVSLRSAIATGRLGPGARLPSTRVLARQLGVSRNTAVTAYDELAARGLLEGRVGAGSFVSRTPPVSLAAQCWFRDASGNLLTLSALP